ncbi:hypothetical protein TOK_5856 [Pseudonocardia sp. N23]|nr:hypothetical protein TOK_5856 [Pseudonocardia sp. N23]
MRRRQRREVVVGTGHGGSSSVVRTTPAGGAGDDRCRGRTYPLWGVGIRTRPTAWSCPRNGAAQRKRGLHGATVAASDGRCGPIWRERVFR